MKQKADAIVLASIDSIDRTDMKYSNFGTTYGTLTVQKVLYGSINQTKPIPYTKEGGIVKYEDWQAVHDVELDPSYSYIQSYLDTDTMLEADKTYLVYLIYNKDLQAYDMIGYGEGIREVKDFDLNAFSSIKIKNNQSQEYELLQDYIDNYIKE